MNQENKTEFGFQWHITNRCNLRCAHSHSNEQTGIVLDGEMKLTIGNETRLCQKGDAFAVPGNVEHSVANGDKLTITVEAFSPPREDYK